VRRRNKPFSNRSLKLTEAQQAEVDLWLASPRTMAQKAIQLGISRRALYDYIHEKHKPRKPADIGRSVNQASQNWEVTRGTIEERP